MPLLRSNVEFAKRVFIDRLTTDQQPLLQPDPGNIDEGPGDDYVYAACYDPFNLGIGADCSGSAGIFIGAAMRGPAYMSWTRQFDTESFPGPFEGFRQTTQDDLVNNYYPIKVCIMRGGGGPNSHMNCTIDGVTMESNGDNGTTTLGHGAIAPSDSYWNTWYVLDEPVAENTTYRSPMSYPQGLDYTAPISAASLVAAGKSFVCRYVTPSLQWKCLQPAEFEDLCANGVAVVFNYEGTANRMLDGYSAGVTDAQEALDYIRSLPRIPTGYWPIVYFSCDFDEAPDQDAPIEDYCRGAASVLSGVRFVGIYGSYYICQRAIIAGVVAYSWQTEAWSGGNIDSDVNILQRNALGYQTIDGVQCDIDEARTDDFGQYNPGAAMPNDIANEILDQLAGQVGPDGKRGWPQLQGYSVVDYLGKVVGPALQQIQATLTAQATKPAPPAPPPAPAPGPKKKGWL